MKKNAILFLLCFITLSSYSQKLKVDLDKELFPVSFVRLPTTPVLDANYRTYSVRSTGTQNSQIEDKIVLNGFEKIRANGTISIDVSIENIIIDKVDVVKREEVKKDKDGNTSHKFFYKPVVTYTTRGSYYIKDHTGAKPRSNRVGKSANVFEGKEFKRYGDAKDYYNNNRYTFKNGFIEKFINAVGNTVSNKINRKYGYVVHYGNPILWILDSKKNPENVAHKKAFADIKDAFSEMKHNQPIDGIKEKMEPIIAYFESVIPKYNDLENKRHRKMRYASYYNIAKIYFYLEMPDKAIEYATKLVENGYDKGDGERIIKNSKSLKKQFETNQVSTRHFPIETVDNSHLENNNATINVQPETNQATSVRKAYLDAYVITKTDEKIEGKVETLVSKDADDSSIGIPSINKYVKIYIINDDDDDVTMKKFYAKDVKKVVINNVIFESVYFTSVGKEQVQGNVVDLDAAFKGPATRFCKVVYKSDKIGVYAFRNELILKKSADKKASSTSSLGYIMAFKKKLSKYVGDCKELASQVKDGEFENTGDSLAQLAKEYTENCK